MTADRSRVRPAGTDRSPEHPQRRERAGDGADALLPGPSHRAGGGVTGAATGPATVAVGRSDRSVAPRSHWRGTGRCDDAAAVKLFALTGGIGSGKSSVAARLEARGAVIVDSDQIVHELQQPGMPVVQQMVERFGRRSSTRTALDPTGRGGDRVQRPRRAEGAQHHRASGGRRRDGPPDRGTGGLGPGGDPDIPLLVETIKRPPSPAVLRASSWSTSPRGRGGRGSSPTGASPRPMPGPGSPSRPSREERLAIAGLVLDNGGDRGRPRRRGRTLLGVDADLPEVSRVARPPGLRLRRSRWGPDTSSSADGAPSTRGRSGSSRPGGRAGTGFGVTPIVASRACRRSRSSPTSRPRAISRRPSPR